MEIPQHEARRLWLAMLLGPDVTDTLEIRFKPTNAPLRRYEHGFYGIPELVDIIPRLASRGDVFVGVAPRRHVLRLTDHKRSGGLDAIARVWCIYADADTPDAIATLKRFRNPPPSVLVSSGNGLHAYWALRRPLQPAHARRANRRIALALGCDMNATDAARIMRPPGTFNHKSDPPTTVECVRLDLSTYVAPEVVAGLPDPAEPTPSETLVRRASGDIDSLLAGACRKVREAQSGNRNAALNWAAFALGKRIADGELDEADVRGELHAAAIDAGLADAESMTTINKGLVAGMRR